MKVESSILKGSEIEIIKRLNDEVYTVEFFNKFLGSADAADSEEQKIEAAGFFRAVQRAAESDLHIFPKAYVRMFDNLGNTVDKFEELSKSFKILMNNTEDLFILSGETD